MSPAKQKMTAPQARRRSFRFTSLALLVGVGACTSVLGIEDLHEGARPGAGGEDSTAGTSSTTGGKNTGGNNGNGGSTSPDGGAPDPHAGAGNEPSGGMPAGGTSNDAGAGGEGGAAPITSTVTGTLVDYWGQKIPNATLQIGDQQVSTDDDGVFIVEHVAESYDVSLFVGSYGWVFQGLTRRDPTLQIFSGLQFRSTWMDANFKPGTTVGTNENIFVSMATLSGLDQHTDVGTDSTFYLRPEWEGGATATGTAHALYWSINPTTKLPAVYKAYDSQTRALTDDVDGAPITFDLTSPTPFTSKAVTGTVTPYGTATRTNSVFARFTSGAIIQIVDDAPNANAFSYLVPEGIPNATFTVAAWEGSTAGPMGLVHKGGLSAGDDIGALDIPAPPTVLTPPSGASNVDGATNFTFKSSADNAGAFLVTISADNDPQVLYIVTTKKKFQIPSVVDGAFVLYPDSDYSWWVETHGSFATVDEMTGPTGWFDEFGKEYSTPLGVEQPSGSYTSSAFYQFTTKP
jgi:hypothetical protein